MKKILVPTDFSENAGHALQYAVLLAKAMQAEILLLNIHMIYVPVSEVPVVPVSPKEFEEQSVQLLKREAGKIPQDVKHSIYSRAGLATDEINYFVENEGNIDLVVMGIRGSNKLSQMIFGSTATSVLHQSKIPVIIIPEQAPMQLPATIAFAFDNKENYDNATLALLKEFSHKLNCKIRVLHVCEDLCTDEAVRRTVSRSAGRIMEGVDYTLHYTENEDVVQALTKFVDQNSIGMVSMIYHKHNLFYRLFVGSRTSKMAFYTHKPLLILPGKKL